MQHRFAHVYAFAARLAAALQPTDSPWLEGLVQIRKRNRFLNHQLAGSRHSGN